jgi:phytanoyl-CoA hydroxylase
MNLDNALQGGFSFHKDSEEALKHYNEYGFHIEKRLIEHDYCDKLIENSYGLKGAKVNDFKPAMMPHREDAIYFEALKNPKITHIIGKLVSGVPMGLQTQFFYCPPGTRGFSLHQDNFFVQAKDSAFVSAWIALTDVPQNKAALIAYPGSHKAGLLPIRPLEHAKSDPNQDPNANNEETVVPNIYSPFNISVEKGDVVFLHSLIVHGSNANKTDEYRYVLLNTYIKENEKFRTGNYAQRTPLAVV